MTPTPLRLLVVLALAGLAACTGVRPLPAPPEGMYKAAVLPGYGKVRSLGAATAAERDRMAERLARPVTERPHAGEALPTHGRPH